MGHGISRRWRKIASRSVGGGRPNFLRVQIKLKNNDGPEAEPCGTLTAVKNITNAFQACTNEKYIIHKTNHCKLSF
jgi:hypothetical protein